MTSHSFTRGLRCGLSASFFIAVAAAAGHAAGVPITIPEHGDFVVTLRNDQLKTAADLLVSKVRGTDIGGASSSNEIFGVGDVERNSVAFEAESLGGAGTGLASGEMLTILFAESFSAGTMFNLVFSYHSDGQAPIEFHDPFIVAQGPAPLPNPQRDLTIGPEPSPIPLPGSALLLALGGIGLWAPAAWRRRGR